MLSSPEALPSYNFLNQIVSSLDSKYTNHLDSSWNIQTLTPANSATHTGLHLERYLGVLCKCCGSAGLPDQPSILGM